MFVELKDFVIPSVPRLNFEGTGNAHSKKRVLNHLLTQISIAIEDRNPNKLKKWPWATNSHSWILLIATLRRGERGPSSSNSPTKFRHRERHSAFGDNQTIPRAREDSWALLRLKKFSNTTLSPCIGPTRRFPKEQCYKSGITIKEGHETRPPRAPTVLGKGKRKATLGPAQPKVDTPSPRLWRP